MTYNIETIIQLAPNIVKCGQPSIWWKKGEEMLYQSNSIVLLFPRSGNISEEQRCAVSTAHAHYAVDIVTPLKLLIIVIMSSLERFLTSRQRALGNTRLVLTAFAF